MGKTRNKRRTFLNRRGTQWNRFLSPGHRLSGWISEKFSQVTSSLEQQKSRRIDVQNLEPRILFSGSPAPAPDPTDPAGITPPAQESTQTPSPSTQPSGDAANLIVNGSFEDPALPEGTWSALSEVPGWDISSSGDGNYLEIEHGILGGPDEGNQHAELDGHSPTAISQTVATEAGATYRLTLAHKARPDTSPSDNVLEVSAYEPGSTAGATALLHAIISDAPADWTDYIYEFTATGAETTLRFADLGPANTLGTFIDDITLYKIADPAPHGCFDLASLDAPGGAYNLTVDGTTAVYRDTAGRAGNTHISVVGGNLRISDTAGPVTTDIGTREGTNTVLLALGQFEDFVFAAGDLDDTITVGDMGSFSGSFTLLGQGGFDTVTFSSGMGMHLGTGQNCGGADESLSVTAEQLVAQSGADVSVVGAGKITLTAVGGTSKAHVGILIDAASFTSGAGDIALTGQGGTTGTHQYGVHIKSATTLASTGGGSVTITGTGGGTSYGHGVTVAAAAAITSTADGGTALTGTAAGTSGNGIIVAFATTPSSGDTMNSVAAGTAGLTITGSATATAGSANKGVSLTGGSFTSAAAITITGTGSGTVYYNSGVELSQTRLAASGTIAVTGTAATASVGHTKGILIKATALDAASSDISLTGTGGGSSYGHGVSIETGSSLTTTGGGGVTITGTGAGQSGSGVLVAFATPASSSPSSENSVTAGTGGLTIAGTATGATGSNGKGVSLAGGTFSSAAGITVTGTGSGTVYYNSGVELDQTALSASGTIAVTGTAATASVGHTKGILIKATALDAASSDISLTGTGGGSSFGHGVSIETGSSLTTTGGGGVTITGTGAGQSGSGVLVAFATPASSSPSSENSVTAGTGGLIIAGTATGVTGSYGKGVSLTGGTFTSAAGITVTGTGSGSVYYNYGVELASTSLDGGGTLTVTGTAATSGVSTNIGVLVKSTTLDAGTSDISITGAGGGTSLGHGVSVEAGSSFTTTESGSVTVTGTGAGASGSGVLFELAESSASESSADSVSAGSGGIQFTGTATAATGSNGKGVSLTGGSFTSAAAITITGTGSGTVYYNHGTEFTNTRLVASDDISVTGTAAQSASSTNVGIRIAATEIDAGGIALTGSGGGSSYGHGVSVEGGTLNASGDYSLWISGTGAGSSGVGVNLIGVAASSGYGGVYIAGEATGESGSNNKGIYVDGGSISAGEADILFRGTGSGSGIYAHGIELKDTEVTASTITMSGFSGTSGTSNNKGVRIAGTLISALGSDGEESDSCECECGVTTPHDSSAIRIEGVGGGTGSNNHGVEVADYATVEITGKGDISLSGHGGHGTTTNYGVFLDGSEVITSDGNLKIEGSAQGSAANNNGVKTTGATVSAGEGGTILIAGYGGVSGYSANTSVLLGGATSVDSANGNILIYGGGFFFQTGVSPSLPDVSITGGTQISSVGGRVILATWEQVEHIHTTGAVLTDVNGSHEKVGNVSLYSITASGAEGDPGEAGEGGEGGEPGLQTFTLTGGKQVQFSIVGLTPDTFSLVPAGKNQTTEGYAIDKFIPADQARIRAWVPEIGKPEPITFTQKQPNGTSVEKTVIGTVVEKTKDGVVVKLVSGQTQTIPLDELSDGYRTRILEWVPETGLVKGNGIMTRMDKNYRDTVEAALELVSGADLCWIKDDKNPSLQKFNPEFSGEGDWFVLSYHKEGTNKFWLDLKHGIFEERNGGKTGMTRRYLTIRNADGVIVNNDAGGQSSGNDRRINITTAVKSPTPVASGVHDDGFPKWTKINSPFPVILWHEVVGHSILELDGAETPHKKNEENTYIIKNRFDSSDTEDTNRDIEHTEIRTALDDPNWVPDKTVAYENEVRAYLNSFENDLQGTPGIAMRRPWYYDYYDPSNARQEDFFNTLTPLTDDDFD